MLSTEKFYMKHTFYHLEKNGKPELLKKGVSWTAFFSSLCGMFYPGAVIWLLIRRLWFHVLIWISVFVVLAILISVAPAGISEVNTHLGYMRALILLIVFIMTILPFFYGNNWTLLNRLKNGYIERGVITAPNEIEAYREIQKRNDNNYRTAESLTVATTSTPDDRKYFESSNSRSLGYDRKNRPFQRFIFGMFMMLIFFTFLYVSGSLLLYFTYEYPNTILGFWDYLTTPPFQSQ